MLEDLATQGIFKSLLDMKKDPGIPNLFPLKEQLLKQMEERKIRSEEQKARQKAQRHKEHTKRRSLQGLQNDAQKRTREFEKKVSLLHIQQTTLYTFTNLLLLIYLYMYHFVARG